MQRLILLLLLSLLIGCGQSENKTQETPKPAEQAATTTPAPPPTTEATAPPVTEPAATETMPAQPAAGTSSLRGDPEKGGAIYAQLCSTCHGLTGGGDGPAAAALEPKPAPHNNAEYMAKISDEEMFSAIKNGGVSVGKSPLMPPWGATLSDEQIRDVLAFTRTLAATN